MCNLYAHIFSGKQNFDGLSWFTLKQANEAFDAKDFGTAFRLAEEAKDRLKTEIAQASEILKNALSVPAVLKAGDNAETVLNLLKERNNTEAADIIENILFRFGAAYFDYSIRNIITFVQGAGAYPEADFLLGKLYMLEGEYGLSEDFYAEAYKNRLYLEIPDMQFDILYAMAELYALTNDNEKYESVLLILASYDDIYIKDGARSSFIQAVRAAVEHGMNADKFFLLYRNDNFRTLYVWFLLTKYYQSFDSDDKAFDTALLFCLTALSRTDSIVKSRELEYSYKNFTDLLKKIKAYADISDWAGKNKLWEGFYLLGKIAQKYGCASFAREIFTALAEESPDRTWKTLAKKALAE